MDHFDSHFPLTYSYWCWATAQTQAEIIMHSWRCHCFLLRISSFDVSSANLWYCQTAHSQLPTIKKHCVVKSYQRMIHSLEEIIWLGRFKNQKISYPWKVTANLSCLPGYWLCIPAVSSISRVLFKICLFYLFVSSMIDILHHLILFKFAQ